MFIKQKYFIYTRVPIYYICYRKQILVMIRFVSQANAANNNNIQIKPTIKSNGDTLNLQSNNRITISIAVY